MADANMHQNAQTSMLKFKMMPPIPHAGEGYCAHPQTSPPQCCVPVSDYRPLNLPWNSHNLTDYTELCNWYSSYKMLTILYCKSNYTFLYRHKITPSPALSRVWYDWYDSMSTLCRLVSQFRHSGEQSSLVSCCLVFAEHFRLSLLL